MNKLFDEKNKMTTDELREKINPPTPQNESTEVDNIEEEQTIENADMQAEVAEIEPETQTQKQAAALAQIDPQLAEMQMKMKRQQAAISMVLQTTSAMDWSKFGNMHCLNASACKRMLAMIGLELQPGEPEKEFLDDSEAIEKLKTLASKLPDHKEEIESVISLITPSGHYAYKMEGTVTIPNKAPMEITAYVTSKMPFFSRAHGADIKPKDISEENIRQCCISKWYRNALDCATGLQKIPADMMMQVLGKIKASKVNQVDTKKWGNEKKDTISEAEANRIKAKEKADALRK